MRRISEPFKIITKDGLVFGYYNPDGSVKITKGSYFRKFVPNNLLPAYRNKRAYLLNNGYVRDERLIKDYIFDSPSSAICILTGNMNSEHGSFYTINNIELTEYLESLLEFEISSENIDDVSEKKFLLEKSLQEIRQLLKKY